MSLGLTFGAYWPLLLLLLIPYVWWIRRKTWIDPDLRHTKVLGLVRSAIIAALAVALMEPAIQRSGALVSAAYLLDVSQSVSPADIQSAIRWIRQTSDSGKPDHARYIPFGANARVFESLNQLEAVGVAENPTQDAIGQNATNIEVAVDSALENFDPHHLKRLVLITDGNENRGHVMNTIRRLQSENVRVYTMLLGARSDRDISIESITAPPEVAAWSSPTTRWSASPRYAGCGRCKEVVRRIVRLLAASLAPSKSAVRRGRVERGCRRWLTLHGRQRLAR